MQGYIDLAYKPKKEDLVTEYYIEPNGISLEEACNHIAAESSIGTWTDISTMSRSIAKRLAPHVFSIDKKTKEVKIAYPAELFEAGNMPEIFSSIAGNIFGMKAVKCLRLQDIDFPESIIDSFKGPRFGIGGIRKLLRVPDRPLVGTIVKPKVGLSARQHAKVCYEAWVGGLDIVKDDENLTSMKFNRFDDRIRLTLKMRDRAEKETGEKKIYMPNITAETNEMLRRALKVKREGGEYIMVDILTIGWSGLQTVRDFNEELNMVMHAHRAMHATMTKNRRHGISMMAIAKASRLIGVDQLHVGTVNVGKMVGSAGDERPVEHEIESSFISENPARHVLEQDWHKIKPVLAVASGGLHPGSIPKLISIMGRNIVMQFGGGVHGHPQGTRAGAKAVKQALDATMAGIALGEYAKNHAELGKAISKWGIA